jgi:hypothetical protein
MLGLNFVKTEMVLSFGRTEIARASLEANLTDNYIGITAVTDSRVSNVNLMSVKFKVSEQIAKRASTRWQPAADSQFQPALDL